MTNEHSPSDDIVYDMISIQYHSLKAVAAYEKFLADAHDHEDVADFIKQIQSEDSGRVTRCHELIKELMGASAHQH